MKSLTAMCFLHGREVIQRAQATERTSVGHRVSEELGKQRGGWGVVLACLMRRLNYPRVEQILTRVLRPDP